MLLYSTNTWLAHYVSATFYGDLHWVYCTPTFTTRPSTLHGAPQPRSSSPKQIYWEFVEDVRTNDAHSAKIAQNRVGLKKGALARQMMGAISPQDAAHIVALVDAAILPDFRPLLYVIPETPVKARLKRVPATMAASMYSVEYILEDLHASEFQALELHL